MRCSEVVSWLIPVTGALHVAEEALFDWVAWTRLFIPGVTWVHFGIVNATFLGFLPAAPSLGRRWPSIGLAAPLLLWVNVPVHLIPTLATGTWSPGLATALGFYVPISFWAVHCARPRTAQLLQGGVVAISAMALPFLVQWLRLRLSH